jgi:CheY-like chemotaxis protein
LTRQLLTFSRTQPLEYNVICLNKTIGNLSQMMQRIIGSGVQIELDLAPDLLPVSADPSKIEQVVLNLAVNGRDAMPDGGQLVITTRNIMLDDAACRSEPDAQPGPYVQVSVRDTGVGMDAATQQRIFEPFFTTKAHDKGTGLGLTMVYGIVKQHKGLLHVTSAVGAGTTFTVYLPAQGELPVVAAEAPPVQIQGGTEHLLVAEDDPMLQPLVTTMLERLGYTVVLVPDGCAAVQLFTADPLQFDLVVLDVAMPGCSGREALVQMRALRHDLPAIFVTGFDDTIDLTSDVIDIECCTELLHKPYRFEALAYHVRALLDR